MVSNNLTILYRNDFARENYYREKNGQNAQGFLFSSKSGTPLPCCRRLNVLIFNNPKVGNKSQSWSNVYSISRPQSNANAVYYDKHLFEKNYNGKESKYGEGVPV